jgi:hypothetical protein
MQAFGTTTTIQKSGLVLVCGYTQQRSSTITRTTTCRGPKKGRDYIHRLVKFTLILRPQCDLMQYQGLAQQGFKLQKMWNIIWSGLTENTIILLGEHKTKITSQYVRYVNWAMVKEKLMQGLREMAFSRYFDWCLACGGTSAVQPNSDRVQLLN